MDISGIDRHRWIEQSLLYLKLIMNYNYFIKANYDFANSSFDNFFQ